MNGLPLPTAEVEAHVVRLCDSSVFANSPRLRDLLRHTITEAVAGRRDALKESVLGVTVFGRKPGYDSDANSIVRVEFARLRKKLEQYYEAEGAGESVRVVFPRGTYAPEFVRLDAPAVSAFAGSVVVLPFMCLGSDPDDECFADGLTDELITALTRVPGLKVVARTSSFTFKGRTDDIRAIGSTLQVDTVLEGSVRRQKDLLRIHAQLVNVRDGCHIWAGKFERRLTAVFQIQEEIAAAIVAALKIELPRHLTPSVRIIDPEAHSLYLKGRYWWHRWNPEALRKAAGFFQQAIERDPGCAGAYSGLADCLFLQGYYGYGRPKEVMPRSQASARKAIEIDPQLGEAYCSLAILENAWEWNTEQCGIEFHRCFERNPNYAMAAAKYATSYLQPVGLFEESTKWLKRALLLDPLSSYIQSEAALNLAFSGDFERFELDAAAVLEHDPACVRLYWVLGKGHAIRGDKDGAIEATERSLNYLPEDPTTLGFAAAAHALCGNKSRAAELRGKLEFLAQIRYVPFAARALAYDALDSADIMFEFCEKAIEEREPFMRLLRKIRFLTTCSSDPRYELLLDKVGIGEQHITQAAPVNLAR